MSEDRSTTAFSTAMALLQHRQPLLLVEARTDALAAVRARRCRSGSSRP
jgi:hypothetical protein